MEGITKRIARKADRTISLVQKRLHRYLNREERKTKRTLNLTLGKAYSNKWEDLSCVFALSTGRTGTQTLAAMLRLSPKVVAEHEPAPRLVKATFDAYMETGTANWLERWSAFVLAARDDFVLAANAEGKVYVESNNRLTYIAHAVQDAFPASKFIFSHRDPYSVIRSGMQRGAYQEPNKAWNFARIRPRAGEEVSSDWDRMTPLEKEAWRWARINEEARAFYDALPESRRFELPAKTFFSGRGDVYKEIFSFVGVPCPSLEEINQVMGRKMNAQAHFNGKSFEWTDEKKAKVKPYIERVATMLGYEI